MHALNELRKGNHHVDNTHRDSSKVSSAESKMLPGNKLITEYFPGSFVVDRNKNCLPSSVQSMLERSSNSGQPMVEKSSKDSGRKRVISRNHVRNTKIRDIPSWCCIPGTPFRVV